MGKRWRVSIIGSGARGSYTYEGRGGEAIGTLVRVPFGVRTEWGVVMGDGGDWTGTCKMVHRVEHGYAVMSADSVKLAEWIAGYYGCGLGRVLEVMIPRALRGGVGAKTERWIGLAEGIDAAAVEVQLARAPGQRKIYDALRSMMPGSTVERGILLKRLGIGAAVLEGLIAKGIVVARERAVEREAYRDALGGDEVVGQVAPQLTQEQAQVLGGLAAGLRAGKFGCECLHGVTGSGKTEVYIRLMAEALAGGGSVIFLVPEVALTPQTVGRIRGRLEQEAGVKAVVWHSHLSDGERHDAWRAMATGAARVVVGARSAIFAPVQSLRLVIVDEEHEMAYKQEEVPRYHGRDVAVYRAYLSNAYCVLGSATPSLETLRNIETGKYGVQRMLKRVDDRKLPLMHIVDMRREGKTALQGFSQLLSDKLRERWERREQSILFINRRGYDASLLCPDCGYVALCDHCDITLTHHRYDRLLRCHLCGHEEYVPSRCPQCKSRKIAWRGSGTQKVEDIARRLLPGAIVERIDADTMGRKHSFRERLNAFRQGKIDILVGTQMIAKGLDFPNVTLVGLMDADISLHMPDFRAAERTFQLLVQVSGRAGRGDLAGEVVVQTYIPHSAPLNYARQHDFSGFIEEEMQHRKEFNYPPYRHLIHHIIRGRDRDKVAFYAQQWGKTVREVLEPLGVEIRGPAPCPIERIKDQFRYQLWYFAGSVSKIIAPLQAAREAFPWDKNVVEILDVDAYSLS